MLDYPERYLEFLKIERMKMIKVVSRIERISLQNNILKRKLYAIKISRKLVKKHIIEKTRNVGTRK